MEPSLRGTGARATQRSLGGDLTPSASRTCPGRRLRRPLLAGFACLRGITSCDRPPCAFRSLRACTAGSTARDGAAPGAGGCLGDDPAIEPPRSEGTPVPTTRTRPCLSGLTRSDRLLVSLPRSLPRQPPSLVSVELSAASGTNSSSDAPPAPSFRRSSLPPGPGSPDARDEDPKSPLELRPSVLHETRQASRRRAEASTSSPSRPDAPRPTFSDASAFAFAFAAAAAAAAARARSKRGCAGIASGDGVWQSPQKGWPSSCDHVGRRKGSLRRSHPTSERNSGLMGAPRHSPESSPGGSLGSERIRTTPRPVRVVREGMVDGGDDEPGGGRAQVDEP